VERLLTMLGQPQRSFRSIHVVGTNGKSSTARYSAAIMTAHGLHAAAYLSPHLTGYPERVLLDGAPVGAALFGDAVDQVRAAVARLPADVGETTQFEVLTVAALLAMAKAGVETAAIEAGLGGRLDATNVLRAPVVALTNIGLEHTDVLGSTRESIFAEKAAVISPGAQAVFGELDGLEALAEAHCRQVGAAAHFVGRDILVEGGPDAFAVRLTAGLVDDSFVSVAGGPRTSAGGARVAEYADLCLSTQARYQTANAALAVAACHCFLGSLLPEAVRRGLAEAVVPGRLQVVGHRPLIVADGAHNPHGAAALAASVAAWERGRPSVLLLGVMADKAVDEMLTILLPLADEVVCTRATASRSMAPQQLAERVRNTGFAGPIESADVSYVAYERALARAGKAGSVLVTGSLYLLEDLASALGARWPG
jgi:dihydrofolate synthase/folylpolyglutamate synthase